MAAGVRTLYTHPFAFTTPSPRTRGLLVSLRNKRRKEQGAACTGLDWVFKFPGEIDMTRLAPGTLNRSHLCPDKAEPRMPASGNRCQASRSVPALPEIPAKTASVSSRVVTGLARPG
ncbi:hypothetical protein SKAU_G00355820 [Synaphobranchus kaupii]|uniref:Uncharacterized protein n=1 Tax=Synaphobranchus kaupii TaxID=118154 RepID=A0A9Q1EHA1_SYNKA|nr:hypothetical protein SKAU_G00355820 [Synaphobranchus kaupii]